MEFDLGMPARARGARPLGTLGILAVAGVVVGHVACGQQEEDEGDTCSALSFRQLRTRVASDAPASVPLAVGRGDTRFGRATAPAIPYPVVLPKVLEGVWEGVPHISPFGPWVEPVRFAVKRTTVGEYVFENNLQYDMTQAWYARWGYQRFFVNKSGVITYCPGPRFDPLPSHDIHFKVAEITSHNLTLCMTNVFKNNFTTWQHPWPFHTLQCYGWKDGLDLPGCGCWKLKYSVDSKNESVLHYTVDWAGNNHTNRTNHYHVVMNRRENASAPVEIDGNRLNWWCRYSINNRSGPDNTSLPLGCPMAGSGPEPKRGISAISAFAAQEVEEDCKHCSLPNCFLLNRKVGYVFEWKLTGNDFLQVRVSAKTSLFHEKTYVSIGFRPWGGMTFKNASDSIKYGTGREQRFGMRGADIVLGGLFGSRQMYSESWAGAPVNDSSLQIHNTSVEHNNGRMILSFTRPLVGGKLKSKFNISASLVPDVSSDPLMNNLPDIIWAIGQYDDDHKHPAYHFNYRGWRRVNFTHPTSTNEPLLGSGWAPWQCQVPNVK
uniref:Uncharacterized protein n=1 Tax=Zooxanthella nutricula TaxID=1333877 RepID=A0A6U6QBS7_9DINO|mmetsp:Transcript_6524/g.19382  ORF Transcript_6524/g.19382 Transcript_6524/m.19382 type:complete len:547 (+) Transcript_6524:52-1692(+)